MTTPRWVIAAFTAVVVALLSAGVSFYRVQESQLRRQAEADLATIAQMKADQIAAWLHERMADAAVVMERPALIADVVRWMAEPQPEIAKEMLRRFRTLQRHYKYQDVLLVNTAGKVLLSLSGDPGAVHAGASKMLAAALRERKPVLVDVHIEADDPTPHTSVVAPLFTGKGESETPLGAVVLVSNARRFLYPLIQSWPVATETAETLLVRRDGDDVLFLNDLRHQRDAALKLRVPLSRTNVPAVAAALGKQGFMEGKDYRGVEVLAYVKAIPHSPWFMVAKVDEAEALAVWRLTSSLVLLLLLASIATVAGVLGMFWQRNAKGHYRALYRAEAAQSAAETRYATTLMSIGDAVIATDAAGRVDLLNPVAQALTGWRQEEARGKPLHEVFAIINEETRQEIENPVQRVKREGIVVGLANHTLLIARDGKEYPIADSGAPIRDENGTVTGVVLVFRDQTEERGAQRALRESEERLSISEKKYRDLVENINDVVYATDREGILTYVSPVAQEVLGYSPEELTGRHFVDCFHADEAERLRVRFDSILERVIGPAEFQIYSKSGELHWVRTSSRPALDAAGHVVGIQGVVTDITARKHTEHEQERLQAQLLQAQKMEAVGRLAGGVAHDFNNMLFVIKGYAEIALRKVDPAGPLHHELREILTAAQRSTDLTRQLLAFARKQTVSPKVLDLNDTVGSMLRMLQRLIGENIDLAWVPGHDLWPVKIDPSQIDQILANLAVNARDAIAGVGKITIETANAVLDAQHCLDCEGCAPGDYVLLAFSDNGRGMDPDTVTYIFEPFFTTKGVGEGTGMGLATVYGIVNQNGGCIDVYSEPGKGTTFKIHLPRFVSEAGAVTVECEPVAPEGGTETVLLVEDEEPVLDLGKAVLENLGYRVFAANTAAEALRVAGNDASGIDLLITDVVMPEMSGRDLAERITAMMPGLKCLYMSGYTADVISNHGVLDEGVLFIQKPFSIDDLARKVREALAA